MTILNRDGSEFNPFHDDEDSYILSQYQPQLDIGQSGSYIDNPDQFNLFSEPEHYLKPKKWGFFTILALKPGEAIGSTRRQYSYPLKKLPEVIKHWRERSIKEGLNVYITQASFRKMNRRKANFNSIGQLFVDIDHYSHPSLYIQSRTPEEIAMMVYQHCDMHDFPYPSVIMKSGKGIYAKWLFDEIPSRLLKMWEHTNSHLVALFNDLGADANAKDVSRVLRLQGTVNQKSGEFAEVLDVNWDGEDPACYRFEDLARKLLPHSIEDAVAYNKKREEVRQQWAKKKRLQRQFQASRMKVFQACNELSMSHGEIKAHHVYELFGKGVMSIQRIEQFVGYWHKARAKGHIIDASSLFSTKNLNWTRFQDIMTLANHRYGQDGVEDGLRDLFMLLGTNHFSLSEYRKADINFMYEFQQIGSNLVPHWSKDKVNNAASDIYKRAKKAQEGKIKIFNGVEYPHLLTPRNDFIIDKLGITDDEMMIQNDDGSFLLGTIISKEIKQQRKPIHQERRRREAGVQARESYVDNVKSEAQARMEKAVELRTSGLTVAKVGEEMGISKKAAEHLLSRAKKAGIEA